MNDLIRLFRKAVTNSMDKRGFPAVVGKADGTVLWVDHNGITHRDKVWVRVGNHLSRDYIVAKCQDVPPTAGLPVRVDNVNGHPTIVGIDQLPATQFSENLPISSVGPHGWLHDRLGSDPIYITGLQYMPLMARPTVPASLSVIVGGGAFIWGGKLKIFEEESISLSSYVPASSGVTHFVIVALDRSTNAAAVIDGSDITGTNDALGLGSDTIPAADIEAVAIDKKYIPLAVVRLVTGQSSVTAIDIKQDVRPLGTAIRTGVLQLDSSNAILPTTSPCGTSQAETATNDVNYSTLDFDQTAVEYAEWSVFMPEDWDGGGVIFDFVWFAAAGVAAETVQMKLEARGYADGDSNDGAWGTVVAVDDALTAVDTIHTSPESSAVTIGGSGDLVKFRLWRDTGNDDLAGDAKIISVRVKYTK